VFVVSVAAGVMAKFIVEKPKEAVEKLRAAVDDALKKLK
jgi:hypothetical protein